MAGKANKLCSTAVARADVVFEPRIRHRAKQHVGRVAERGEQLPQLIACARGADQRGELPPQHNGRSELEQEVAVIGGA